jgi:transposase
MAKSYRPVDRDQVFLLPPNMAEWLESDHLAWFVLDVVNQLDLAAFHDRRRLGGAGRAAYDPQMMLALLLYAYCTAVRSSRRIERLCQVDVAFRVVCAQDVPDHSTIARFRAEHEQALKDLFDQVLVLCARAGLGRLGVVALDGTKIAANASKEANRSAGWLREQVDAMFDEAAAIDAAEDELFGQARGDELPEELADPRTRKARLREALRQLNEEREQAEQAEQDQAERESGRPGRAERAAVQRLTEAEAALERELGVAHKRRAELEERRRADHAAGVAYCGPRAPKEPEDYAKVRRAAERVAAARARIDRLQEQREQAARARRNQRRAGLAERTERARRNTTDPDSRLMPVRGGGWVQGFNAQAVVSADQIVLAAGVSSNPADAVSFEPMMRAAETAARRMSAATGKRRKIGTLLADAGYDSDQNLTVKGPNRLIAIGKTRQIRQAARANPAEGPPPAGAGARDRMDHLLRTASGIDRYAKRSTTVEPVFGHVKEQRGFRRFSRRGSKAAASEWNLITTVHNLLKLHQAQQAT